MVVDESGPARARGIPRGWPVVVDSRARSGGPGMLTGGSPWGVVRLGAGAAEVAARLLAAGSRGLVPRDGLEYAVADRLVERGLAHPVPPAGQRATTGVSVVVPAYRHPELLRRCLDSLAGPELAGPELAGSELAGSELAGPELVVVDDASPTPEVARVARARGARVVRHAVNRGPAAGRNSGAAACTGEVVAFVDADCAVTP
jgi:hypothetical protein